MDVVFVSSVSILLKYLTGLGSHSGKGSPPLHGDFEAQRHWIEITSNLPVDQWYFYDLQYWGLDYPPLTAFHSWCVFKCLIQAYRKTVSVKSRERLLCLGQESRPGIRGTSLIYAIFLLTDRLVCVYQCYYRLHAYIFSGKISGKGIFAPLTQAFAALIILCQPALILIDHGHFQYNSSMLGLVVWSIIFCRMERYVLASIMFSLALLFKQMALYYALPIFCLMLSSCIARKRLPKHSHP